MASNGKLVLVAGAGSGLGDALLQRFAAGGYHAVGLARTERIAPSGHVIQSVDLADPEAVQAIVSRLIAEHGAPATVIHNTAHLVRGPFQETAPDSFKATWSNMVLSAVAQAQAVLPAMQKDGGAFLVSGATASLRGGSGFSAFASAKFALRGLTQSLAREYQADGIHIAHIILDGIIDSARSRDLHDLDPARMMKPDQLAEAYWTLAHQPKSAWTHELDLRPMSENF
ncbi:SDR family NAD(P)-dependent oxidoreductase [Pararhizobium sp. IMCC21322]|uniref:SDR family NAD(P)-dependent oxidoreductase n=1 Tax=Pararhizobium sp. IMCC21322 TaxID=3067903 RepID=UPI002740A320|nr:SDR family NAD(P)-dependent oxidoreductase [Pararhizobium sp. IMCC21322]